jgi:hypothetical protein
LEGRGEYNMIKLKAFTEKQNAKGYIFYNLDEKGFDTFPDIKSDITLLVAYVQIGFDVDDMCSNQVFGLSPAYSWKKQKLSVPTDAVKCALKLEEDFDYGTWRLDRGNEWKTYFDQNTGWVCVGNPEIAESSTKVNFIDNAIAVLDSQGELQSLWIKPVITDDVRLTL